MSESLSTIPYYSLPVNTTMMELSQQNPEGYFGIEAGHTHIFPFLMEVNKPLKISGVLRNIFKQDESLNLWISDYPLKYSLFPKIKYMTPLCLSRTVNHFVINCDDPKTSFYVQPNKTYFINIYNSQNTINEYGLMIDLYNEEMSKQNFPFY